MEELKVRKVAKRFEASPGENEAVAITEAAPQVEKPIIDKPAENVEANYQLPPQVKTYKSKIDEEFQVAEQKLVTYVSRQLELMENNLMFNGEKQPSLYDLDKALCSYEHVLMSLNELYNAARWEVKKAEEAYDEWYAIVFIDTRNELNPKNEPKAKWFSEKEIGYVVRDRYREEHAKFRAAITLAEQKRSFMERLVEGWEKYQWILSTLSKNSIAEYDIASKNLDRQVE